MAGSVTKTDDLYTSDPQLWATTMSGLKEIRDVSRGPDPVQADRRHELRAAREGDGRDDDAHPRDQGCEEPGLL
eukprot:1178259-Heterocapsa_arctica.AAC.1